MRARRGGACGAGTVGAGLLEIVVVLAVLAVVVQLAAPTFVRWRMQHELEAAARDLARNLTRMCAYATASGRSHGLSLAVAGTDLVWEVVADGDGDGIGRADLAAGIDLRLEPPRRLSRDHPGTALDRPAGVPPLNGGSAGRGGLAFGRSPIVSCTPAGAARSGTLYLRSPGGDAAAVRVLGSTARISVWWWQAGAARWAEMS